MLVGIMKNGWHIKMELQIIENIIFEEAINQKLNINIIFFYSKIT